MICIKELKAAVERECEKRGIKDWEFLTSNGTSISASMTNGEIVEFSSSTDTSILLRVIVAGKEGSACSDSVTVEEIPSLVQRALSVSRVKAEDTSYSPEIYYTDKPYPEKKGKNGLEFSASQIKETLGEKFEAIKKVDERVSETSNVVSASANNVCHLENSKGLSLMDEYISSNIYVAVVARDGEEVKSAGTCIEGDIRTLDAQAAVRKATDKLGSGTVKSSRPRIIFSSETFNLFLSAFHSAFSGRSAYLGLSPYKGKVGEKIASPCITLIDDPLYPDYPAQRTFDGDARATYKKNVIEKGELRTLLYNREWAIRSGCESTGNAFFSLSGSAISPYSFYIQPSGTSFEELVRMAESGIYVTSMKGFHAGANSVSGDFSIESTGFLIENGKITKPVEGFTVAGNFFEMLKNIAAVADDLEFDVTMSAFRSGSPSILVDGLSVAGKE